VRYDDRPVSAPNVHSFFTLPVCCPVRPFSLHVAKLVIDLDQLGRALQATLEFPLTGLLLSAGGGMMVPALTISPSLNLARAKSLAAASVQTSWLSADVAALAACHLAALQK
jgi:hypothetical protein